MALDITINTIPHTSQEYETVGNYKDFFKGKSRVIYVSSMGNVDYEFLVAIHEAIEQHLCLKRGIGEKDITQFDVDYEKKREPGDVSEPGDSPLAPYNKEHQFATKVERLIAEELGVEWTIYDNTVNSLGE